MGIYFELSAYNNLLEDGLQIWEQEEVDIKKEIFFCFNIINAMDSALEQSIFFHIILVQ